MLSAIERIEVIRGPAAALYGADAFSGIINIILKNPADADSYVAAIAGSAVPAQGGYLELAAREMSIELGAQKIALTAYARATGRVARGLRRPEAGQQANGDEGEVERERQG